MGVGNRVIQIQIEYSTVWGCWDILFMITFKYKGNGKRFELGDRMTEDKFIRSLTQLFPLKGSVLGFRS